MLAGEAAGTGLEGVSRTGHPNSVDCSREKIVVGMELAVGAFSTGNPGASQGIREQKIDGRRLEDTVNKLTSSGHSQTISRRTQIPTFKKGLKVPFTNFTPLSMRVEIPTQ